MDSMLKLLREYISQTGFAVQHISIYLASYFRRIWTWIVGTEPGTERGRGKGSSVRGSLRSGSRQGQDDRGKGKGSQPLVEYRR
jgi:hypothetical protein